MGGGYNVVLPDARAHGESGGDYISYGFLEQNDLADWVAWVKTQLSPNGQIILYGEGMGAETILFAASSGRLDGSVLFAIAESPYTSLGEMAEYTLGTFYRLPVKVFMPVFQYKLRRSDAGFTADDADLMGSIAQAGLPVIFLGGTRDDYVPYEQTQAVYEAYQGDKELITDAVRHGLVDVTCADEIERTIADYVQKYSR